MQNQKYQITAKVWVYKGKGAWYFVALPKDISEQIKFFARHVGSAFGSIRVNATIGKTSWKTSIFTDSKVNAYLLPIKAEIRKKEKIKEGDTISITLEIST
jgi:hypothetical protein